VRVQVLGRVRVWRGDTELALGSPRDRALLGVLALAPGQPLGRVELIDTLWPEGPPPSAANVIQTHVKHLRRVLDPDRRPHAPSTVLPSVGDGYALHVPADAVDVARFRRLVRAARTLPRHEVGRAADLLAQALNLWQGAPFADVPTLAGHPKVAALQNERLAGLTLYGELMIAAGAAIDALPALENGAARYPLDEAIQALLMRAHHAAGQPARAFEAYHRARRRLADELGVDPGPLLAGAHAALLRSDAATAASSATGASAGAAAVAVPAEDRPPAPPPAQLPADVYGFIGRTTQLSRLDDLLSTMDDADATAAIVAAVSGTAGVGKTALAVHWGHRVRHRFPDGQLYLDLRGHDPGGALTRRDALARLLGALGVAVADLPFDVDERAANWRSVVAGRRLLIVLDNVASVEQVRTLLPGSASCFVVTTSRDSLSGLVALDGAHRVGVDLLAPADAVALLAALLGERVADEPAAARTLAEQCAGLPLALRIAAELASSRPSTPLAGLVAELADRRGRLDLLDVGDDVRGALRTVFSWSYERLPAGSAEAFRWLGLHPGPDIDLAGLAALGGVDTPTARRLVNPLVRAHLVRWIAPDRLAMHELLRAYAAERSLELDPATRQAALTRLLETKVAACVVAMGLMHPAEAGWREDLPAPPSSATAPALTDAAGALAWLDAERPGLVALCALGAATGHASLVTRIAATLWRYFERGHYDDALVVHTHALRAASGTGDRRGEAVALTSLGSLRRLLGRYPAATDDLRRAIRLYRDVDDPVGLARALSNLGVVDERLGRNDSAIDQYEQALALYRRTGDRHGEASTTNNLGGVYVQVEPERAADCYQRSLALYRDLGDRAGEGIALANLGMVHLRLGDHDEALRDCQLALTLFRELGHRYGEAAVLNTRGDVETACGRPDSGLVHQEQALLLFRQLGHRYGEASTLNSLADALRGCGRAAEARTAHRDALAVASGTGDRDEQARAHRGAARACEQLGDPAGARMHLTAALALFTEVDEPQSREVRAALLALDPGSTVGR
jgi:DNA-binding SARP family transcriptional activator